MLLNWNICILEEKHICADRNAERCVESGQSSMREWIDSVYRIRYDEGRQTVSRRLISFLTSGISQTRFLVATETGSPEDVQELFTFWSSGSQWRYRILVFVNWFTVCRFRWVSRIVSDDNRFWRQFKTISQRCLSLFYEICTNLNVHRWRWC